MDLQQRINDRAGEILLFAVTPPRVTTAPERVQQIAEVTLERIRPLDVDGLILYDIDDESDRNPEERPFPFVRTLDPAEFLERNLAGLDVPAVVYRATGKYDEPTLRDWVKTQDPAKALSVFVGASSGEKRVATSLRRAQQIRNEANPDLLLGAVAIPERHTDKGDEHLRLIAKQEAGCSYFVTQVVYD
ncbi:MAG TPA: 5,10-methylenetetrahydrofolate reductase, partial [Nocardioides sp.]